MVVEGKCRRQNQRVEVKRKEQDCWSRICLVLVKNWAASQTTGNLRERLSDWRRQHLDKEIAVLFTRRVEKAIHPHSLGDRLEAEHNGCACSNKHPVQENLQPINHHTTDSFLSGFFFFSLFQISLLLACLLAPSTCRSLNIQPLSICLPLSHSQHMRFSQRYAS